MDSFLRFGSVEWKLYNIEIDRNELINVEDQYPDIVQKNVGQWQQWAIRCKLIPKEAKVKSVIIKLF